MHEKWFSINVKPNRKYNSTLHDCFPIFSDLFCLSLNCPHILELDRTFTIATAKVMQYTWFWLLNRVLLDTYNTYTFCPIRFEHAIRMNDGEYTYSYILLLHMYIIKSDIVWAHICSSFHIHRINPTVLNIHRTNCMHFLSEASV